MHLVQKSLFFQVYFLDNIGYENVFYNIKTKSSKNHKIDIFKKGLAHGFGRKMDIFPTLFVWQYSLGKCLLRYSRTNKRLSRLLKQEVQKS